MALLAHSNDPGSLRLWFMSAYGKALEAGHTRLTLLTCVMDHILSLTPDQGSDSEIHTVVLCFNTFGIEFAAGLLQNLLAMNAN